MDSRSWTDATRATLGGSLPVAEPESPYLHCHSGLELFHRHIQSLAVAQSPAVMADSARSPTVPPGSRRHGWHDTAASDNHQMVHMAMEHATAAGSSIPSVRAASD